MSAKRPVFLNLLKIKLPVTAIVSILHRVSGIAILIVLPVLLYAGTLGVMSENSHISFQELMNEYALIRLIVWLSILVVLLHVLAGVRHMLHDFGVIGHGLPEARLTARLVLYLFVLMAVVSGLRLWY